MDPLRRYELTNFGLFALAVVHAAATWPPERAAVLFVGGAVVAFVLEAVGVRLGLLVHEMGPTLLGVPLPAVLAWPAVVYLAYRVALAALPAGPRAAALAAVLATLADAATERNAVREGVWRYPEHPLSRARVAGVPVWNYLAWLSVVFATAMLPSLLL